MESVRPVERNGKLGYEIGVTYKGKRIVRRFQSAREALAWRDNSITAIDETGRFPYRDDKLATIQFIVDELDRAVDTELNDPGNLVMWWLKHYGEERLTIFDGAAGVNLRDRMLQGGEPEGSKRPANNTVNARFGLLRRLFKLAVDKGVLARNPLEGMKALAKNERAGRVLWTGEIARLIECSSGDLRGAIMLAVGIGARKSEVLGVTWRDLDLEDGVVTLMQAKGGRPRRVHIDGVMAEWFRAKRKTVPFGDVMPVFSIPNFHRNWKKAVERAGLGDIRFHDLRHTAATRAAEMGATVNEMKKAFGWKSQGMVDRYVHPWDQEAPGITAGLAGIVGGEVVEISKKVDGDQ